MRRNRFGERVEKVIKHMLCDQGYPLPREPELVRKRVTFTRYSSGGLDYGNQVGGCKDILDAIVRLKLIVDDAPKWCEERYEQVKLKRGQRAYTTVAIETLGPVEEEEHAGAGR